MSVQRYRRKPKQEDCEVQFAARYEPGQPLDDLAEVARMADPGAELAEVEFPSGTVLAVRHLDIPDDHPSQVKYEVVEPGHYLTYSGGSGMLYDNDDEDWRAFYEQVNGAGSARREASP